MDNIDNGPTHTVSPHRKNSERFKDISTPSDSEADISTKNRHCVSLPLYYDQVQGELCTFASRRGMECMPLRTSSGAYHYHVNDQTKSLQELQNEVGALLEFRDLVIETFPDLKNKMASISASSTGVPSASLLTSRRDWEPGIRVRRKLNHKETSDIHNSSSLTRSRSNSHSNKKEPKSGEGNNASVIQDSGFSTETSSSKETHSATSTNGAGVTTAIGGSSSSNSTSGFQRVSHEAEDELWNLLDVIHRKSTRLRDEMEHLRLIEGGDGKSSDSHHLHHDHDHQYMATHETSNRHLTDIFQLELNRINGEDMVALREDRDRLLDKLAEMEAEVVAGRIRTNQMEDDVNALTLVKRDLEEQLRIALSQKLELNTRLHDLISDRNDIPASYADLPKTRQRSSMAVRKLSSPDTSTYQHSNVLLGNKFSGKSNTVTNNTFSAVIVKSSGSSQLPNSKVVVDTNTKNELFGDATTTQSNKQQEYTLGRLDGLVSSPNRCSKVRVADSRKIAAILLETNIVELQRHLLTITVQNQALTQRLEQATKSKIYLIKKLDKAKEEIDDLKFQLEERNIELEGTKAQLRVMASKSMKSDYVSSVNQVSTPSMKAMTPLILDDLQNTSGTESAHENTERDSSVRGITSRYRPSKIPLPGSKSYLAPKPPTGRNFVNSRSPSGPPSNKSLNKSTSSLNSRYDVSISMQQKTTQISTSPNLYRPESAQSLRKDMSLNNTNRSSSSSIPVSTPKSSPTRTNPAKNSPVPKSKRESFTSKVRNMDSMTLSRMHTSPSHQPSVISMTQQSPIHSSGTHTQHLNNSNYNHNGNSSNNLYKSNSKKDLSSSFSIGQKKQQNSTNNSPVRRVSSNSFGSKGIDLSNTSEPVQTEKVQTNLRRIWNMLKI